MRRVFASSFYGAQLARLAEEIARLVNPSCWWDLRDADPRLAEYRADVQTLLSEQGRLLAGASGGGVGRG